MEIIKTGIKKLFAPVSVLLCFAALFTWAGLVFLPETAGRFTRVIVNDSYDAETAALDAGTELRQDIYAEGRLYGLRLLAVNPENRARGSVFVRLLDKNGREAAFAAADMSEVTDGFFHLFLFDSPLEAGQGQSYTALITAETEPGAAAVAFRKSADFPKDPGGDAAYDLSSFFLSENSAPQKGVLALQYITRYTGTFLYTPYILFSLALTVFFVALYLMLRSTVFPIHRIFLVCSLVLGTVFLFIIPFRTSPDEYVHIANAYRYSNAVLGIEDRGGELNVRSGDEMYLESYDFGATDVFAYKDAAEGIFDPAPDGGGSVIGVKTSSAVFPPLYLPQTAGLLFARLLGAGKFGLLFMGRFFNLICYSLAVMFAIKITPFMKHAVFTAALLPMSLQLAASFSYDAYVIALCFLFTAYVLKCAFETGRLGIKQIALLGLLAVLTAPAKAVYLPVLFFLFIIPANRFNGKKASVAVKLSVITAAVLIWGIVNIGSVKTSAGLPDGGRPAVSVSENHTGSGESPDSAEVDEDESYPVGANNEALQLFTFSYILRHIPQTALLVLRTLWEQGPLWLQGLIGGRLGEIIVINIEINWLFVLGLLFVLLAAALPGGREPTVLKGRTRIAALSAGFGAAALSVLACVTWTPINYDVIFGVQGRYFLPALPLFLLAFRGNNLKFKKEPAKALIFAACTLTVLTALQAFTLIIQR